MAHTNFDFADDRPLLGPFGGAGEYGLGMASTFGGSYGSSSNFFNSNTINK